MAAKLKVMLLQTRYIESISYLSDKIAKALPVDRYEISMVYLETAEVDKPDFVHEQICLNMNKTDYKGLRLRALKKLESFLKEHQFDVIIANMYKPINLLMQLRRSISAKLCIGIIHAFGEFDRFGRRLMMRWMIDERWRIVAVSEPLRQYLISARCGLNASNTLVINNAIDVESAVNNAADKLSARQFLSLPERGFVFGTLGRSVEGKRQLEMVKAFHQLVRSKQNVYLVIMGDGELHTELKSYVVEHRLEEKVFLPGYIPQAVRYLHALDLFVFPSEHEGFGMALLEAMALSLPVIVNKVEPLVSILDDADCTVDTADINVFADMLKICAELPSDVLMQKGFKNYQRVCIYYDIPVYQRAYLDLIEDHYCRQ